MTTRRVELNWRYVGLAAMALLLVAVLGACTAVGPGGGSAAEEMPKLTVWAASSFTPDADETQDNQIKQWAADNGVEVEIARMSNDERLPKWQTAFESRQFPDCAALTAEDVPKFILSDVLAETTDVMDRLNELEGGFNEGAFIAGRTPDGKHWAVPSFSSTEIFYVRKDVLEEHGLEMPDTWEDVRQIAETINNPEDQFWGWGMQMGTPSWDSEVAFTAKLWSMGGSTWDEEGKPAIDSAETRELLQFIKDTWDAGVIPPDGPTWGDGSNNSAYQTEIVGMTVNTGSILRYLQTEDTELLEKTAVIPIPAGPEGRFISGYFYQWGTFNTSEHTDLCLDLFEYIMAPEQLRPFYDAGGGNMLPVYKDMLNDDMWQDPQRKVLADMVPYTYPQGYPGPTTPWVLDAWRQHTMVQMINRVIVDGWEIDDAIAEADEALWTWYNDWQEKIVE